MNLFDVSASTRLRSLGVGAITAIALLVPICAQAALTVTPLTWNVVGLDSNSPAMGPRHFPVGARICTNTATTPVVANFVWDSVNANVNLRTGSFATLNFPPIPAGGCVDAYFEAEVNAVAAAFDTQRQYHVSATDGTGTYSSPTPRALYVEHLVSQSRNAISNVAYGPNPGSLTSVAPGGSMNLLVGNTYTIDLSGGTATQGYEQFEAFINFTNTIFQILSVSTTYSADTTPYVNSPNDKLYGDACLWENDPNSPAYRSCLSSGKIGGSSVVTRYTIKIVGGGGTSQTLNTLLYDFSGSSFHYNADFSTGARIANIIDPTAATIAKNFSPNPATLNGVSVLTITLGNPNAGAISGYNFIDNLPANMLIATPANATTSGCGAPALIATAGTSTINFSNGTVAANGACTIKVNVTTTATGSFVNTTQNLFIDAIDTGKTATATLVVNSDPPPGTGVCGQTLARWSFATGFAVAAPLPTVANVTASAAAGAGLVPNSQTTLTADGTAAWGSNGSITTGASLVTASDEYFEFAVNTTGLNAVYLQFNSAFRSANGPAGRAVFWGTTNSRPETGTSIFSNATAIGAQNTTVAFGAGNSIGVTSGLNPSGNTFFRIYAFNSSNTNPGSDPVIDDVLFTGCSAGIKPTLGKAFAPDPIAVGAVSTLTFTLTNTNASALTGARFVDDLPTGLQVAAAPAAATTCGGIPTWVPAAASTSLNFGTPTGGTIPANGSCTVSVDVTATSAGTKTNVSGFLSTTETGTTTTSVATDTLTALVPPTIAKQFAPDPIIPGGVSKLTFTIVNPNADNAISGVAFNDTLPNAPGIMRVAATPNPATSGCGAPAFAPVATATSIGFSGASIAAGGTCTVSVDVTAPTQGTYSNTSGNVSYIINGSPVSGGNAVDTLTVNPPNPAIALLKQVGPTAAGPWSSFLAVNLPGNVFYRFTVENVGDVPLSPLTLTDPPGGAAVPGCVLPASLPVADNNDDDHIATCISGPFAANAVTTVNTARASGAFSGNTVTDDSSATYAPTGLTIVKLATPTTYSTVGDIITYTFTVTNSGSATLSGPITVLDNQTTNETCPALSTIGDGDNFFDPGEQIVCSATYAIVAADIGNSSVVNVASASNGATTSPSDTETVNLVGPRLTLAKTASPNPFVVGMPASYTITVTNTGTASTVGNITVSDTLPAGITLSTVAGSNWSCSGTSNLSCAFTSTLGVGASTTLTLNVIVSAAAGNGNNTATASGGGDPTCPAAAHCTDSVPVAVVAPQLTVTKSAAPTPFTVGQPASYTVTVTNTGTASTFGNITITDNLPTGITLTSATGANWSCTGTSALSCTFTGTLAVGANTQLILNVSVGIAATNGNNTAVASGGGDPGCPAAPRCSGVVPVGVVAPQLTVTKSATPTPFTVGLPASYTVTVTNTGTASTIGNITLADSLPSGITLASASGANWSCTGTTNLSCTFAGTLAVSANSVLTLNVNVSASASTGNNTATASGGGDPTCPAATRCSGVVPVGIVTPQLSTTKSGTLDNTIVAPNDQSNPGDAIAYTITVTNNGTGAASGVNVSDPLLPILNCSIASIPVSLPTTLNAGASLVCLGSHTLTAGNIATGTVTNTATASATNVCNPTTPGSTCSGTVVTPLALVAIVSTTKSGVLNNAIVPPNNQSNVGDQIVYTITVVNSGNGPANGIAVTDPKLPILTCSIGGSPAILPTSLPAGASLICTGTYTLVNADIVLGSVTNTATVSGGNVCPPGTGCSDTEVTPLGNVPVLTLTKTAAPTPFVVGQAASYTITVTNTGNATTIGNITVTDNLPAGITLASAVGTNWSCTGTSSLNCTFTGTLATGASTALTLNVNVGASATTGDNTATASGGGDPTCPAAARCSDSVPVGISAPQLTLSKTATPNPFVVGQPASYTITIVNTGSAATTGNITVTDTLPAGITLTGASGSNWSCSGTTVLTCTFSSTLAVGANTVLTLNVTVAASATSGNNTATASGGGDPTCPAAARCTDSIPVGIIAPQLTLTKTGSPSPFVIGQPASYTITVANTGSAATMGNVFVADSLPSGITLVSATGTNWSCTGTTNISCTFTGILAPMANTALTLNVSVSAAATTGDNTATASGGGDPTCPTAARCTDSVPIGISAPQLTLTKTATPNPFSVGQPASYTITVANTGTAATLGNIVVNDNLPTGITLLSASGSNWSCAGTSSLTCTFTGVLAVGANTVLTLNVTVTASAANGDNTATASGGGDPTCPAAARCTDSIPVGIAQPDLTIDKSHIGSFAQGQTGAQYSLLVSNIGAGPTVGLVTVTDSLPVGLTATAISGTGWTCTLAPLACSRSDVLAGGANYPPIVLTVDVAGNAAGTLVNSATVSGGADTTPANNTDTDPTVIANGPDLIVVKTHSGDFTQGQIGALYVLSVSNFGNTPSIGLVSITDTLPVGLTATSITGSGWTCTLATLTCTRSDPLAVSASYPTITLTVNVATDAPASVVNNVVVTGGGDVDPTNNNDSDPAVIVVAPTGSPPIAVPVNAHWALWLLVLSMMMAAGMTARSSYRD